MDYTKIVLVFLFQYHVQTFGQNGTGITGIGTGIGTGFGADKILGQPVKNEVSFNPNQLYMQPGTANVTPPSFTIVVPENTSPVSQQVFSQPPTTTMNAQPNPVGSNSQGFIPTNTQGGAVYTNPVPSTQGGVVYTKPVQKSTTRLYEPVQRPEPHQHTSSQTNAVKQDPTYPLPNTVLVQTDTKPALNTAQSQQTVSTTQFKEPHNSNSQLADQLVSAIHSQPNMHQSQQNVHQSQPNMHQRQPNMHQSQQNVHQSQQNVHQSQPNMHQRQPNMHQSQQNVHQSQQNVHQSLPNMHHGQLNMHQNQASSYQGQYIPQVEHQQQQQEQYQQQPPQYQTRANNNVQYITHSPHPHQPQGHQPHVNFVHPPVALPLQPPINQHYQNQQTTQHSYNTPGIKNSFSGNQYGGHQVYREIQRNHPITSQSFPVPSNSLSTNSISSNRGMQINNPLAPIHHNMHVNVYQAKPTIRLLNRQHLSFYEQKYLEYSYGLTSISKFQILELMNDMRATVDSDSMNVLMWSESLAAEAANISSTCAYEEHGDHASVIAMVYERDMGSHLLSEAVNRWKEEKSSFVYGRDCSRVQPHTCRYQQIVWAESRSVGCAVNKCVDMTYLVCVFDPPGNIPKQLPYISGEICTRCAAPLGLNPQCNKDNLCEWYYPHLKNSGSP